MCRRIGIFMVALGVSAALSAADTSERAQDIQGTVSDGSDKVVIRANEREFTVDTAPAAAPGGPRTFQKPFRYSPGLSTVTVYSATGAKMHTSTFAITRPKLLVGLEWAGHDLDYDLYVNDIYYGKRTSGGGVLDRDAYAGYNDDGSGGQGMGIENITFAKATSGVYRVYVNYYSNHWHEGASEPVTVSIRVGATEVYRSTCDKLREPEGKGASLAGTGKSVWNVATVVIHGDVPGGYRVVDANWNEALAGWRDLFMGSLNLPVVKWGDRWGIFPETNYQVSQLTGPNGSERVVIAEGEAAQFFAQGAVNVSTANEQQVNILGKFQSEFPDSWA